MKISVLKVRKYLKYERCGHMPEVVKIDLTSEFCIYVIKLHSNPSFTLTFFSYYILNCRLVGKRFRSAPGRRVPLDGGIPPNRSQR